MSSTGKVRAHELVSKNKADLTKQLGELKQELLSLRVQKVAGGSAAKLTKMCVLCALFWRWWLGCARVGRRIGLEPGQFLESVWADRRTRLRFQQHCPQVDRPGPHGHQPEAACQPPRVLQELEVCVLPALVSLRAYCKPLTRAARYMQTFLLTSATRRRALSAAV